MSFPDALHGWVVRADPREGRTLATTDGGKSWIEMDAGSTHDNLYLVAATDARHSWVGGAFGTIRMKEGG